MANRKQEMHRPPRGPKQDTHPRRERHQPEPKRRVTQGPRILLRHQSAYGRRIHFGTIPLRFRQPRLAHFRKCVILRHRPNVSACARPSQRPGPRAGTSTSTPTREVPEQVRDAVRLELLLDAKIKRNPRRHVLVRLPAAFILRLKFLVVVPKSVFELHNAQICVAFWRYFMST